MTSIDYKKIDGWKKLIPESLVEAFKPSPDKPASDLPVLFIGSGFGCEAVPSLKTSHELCAQLRNRFGIPDAGQSLAELLQYLKNEEAGSDPMVRRWLAEELLHTGQLIAQPGGAHHLLMKLPLREILTTNYDVLLERAATECGIPFDEFSDCAKYQKAAQVIEDREVIIGRLHGSFSDFDLLVATTDDYINMYTQSQWLTLVNEYVVSRRLVFIGYSLRDFTSWTSYFTGLMRGTMPHAMILPSDCPYERKYWDKYHIHFIPLRAGEFLIGLHSALGTLELGENLVLGVAAVKRLAPVQARKLAELRKIEWKYRRLQQAALRLILE